MTTLVHEATMGRTRFIERHGLWTDEQARAADDIAERMESEGIHLVRMAFGDQHGIPRAKAFTKRAFLSALRSGGDMNTGPIFFDTANAITYNPFIPGGGLDLPEMTGCPNLVMVPDPATFRVLPWAPRTGFIICDLYFANGEPFPFCTRTVLKNALARLVERNLEYVAGLEVEWYLTRMVDPSLGDSDLGGPGMPGAPPQVEAAAHGFSYQLEYHLDELADLLADLTDGLEALDLPLRTIEDEWGPGQIETTFDPMRGLETADAMLLFRTAAKQIARRHGYHATFMCRPAFPSFYSSGWHLHQSLVDPNSGENLFAPGEGEVFSTLGLQFVAGLLEHAGPASVFTTPTVTGYKRFKPNSLAPDRAGWGADNRGSMCRVIGAPGDVASRVENRAGEPAANPYLYLASQIYSGLDGIERELSPGEPTESPYETEAPRLPTSLREAVEALKGDAFFRERMDARFIDYLVGHRESELVRYEAHARDLPPEQQEAVTDWEQREYFTLF